MNTKLKPIIVAMGISLALAAGQAKAFTDPATLLPANTTVQFKYNDLEIVVTQVDQILNGIFDITTIGKAPTGLPIYFASGGAAGELNGRFDNLKVAEIVNGVGNNTIYFTGGTISIYSVATGSYTPTGPGDSIDQQICGVAACGTPWLTLDFVTGVSSDLGDGGFNEGLATLVSTVSSVTTPLTGTGDAVLKVTGGTAASTFGIGSTMSLQSNLQSCPDSSGSFGANCVLTGDSTGTIWPLASFDPLVGKTVPEPGTLFLLGAGLLGAGFASRKRKSA